MYVNFYCPKQSTNTIDKRKDILVGEIHKT